MRPRKLGLILSLSTVCSFASGTAPDIRLGQATPTAGCDPRQLALPEEFVVLGAGATAGRRLDFQIDDSGEEATQIDVIVNSVAKPVVLMLGAYEPTIWNIRWTRDTYIAAVVASGHHRQVIAGAPKTLPILITTYDKPGPCGYFYNSLEGSNVSINPVARQLFGRPVELFFPARDGQVTIGSAPADPTQLLTARDNPPEAYFDRSKPLAGEAGLADAVKRGVLRRATNEDVEAWIAAEREAMPPRDEAAVPARVGRLRGLYVAYVVLKPFQYPAGLDGRYFATFLIPKGVPKPTGTPGYSEVFDFNELEARKQRRLATERRKQASLTLEDLKRLPPSQIEKHLEAAHPSLYYLYAMDLFNSNRRNEAVFWFYVGQLRYRFHLLANPDLPADQDAAVFASFQATIGAQINAYAGGDPKAWARQIERALEWDLQHANAFTSKTEHASVYQQNRAGLEKLRTYALENADSITEERRRNGLDSAPVSKASAPAQL